MDTSHLSCKHEKETPQRLRVDWGCLKKETPKHIEASHTCGCVISEVDWGAHETHTSGSMLSEVDWGAHDSSLFLYQEHIDN